MLGPTIGNYFRNSAQDSDVIAFLSTRKERQASARRHINAVLDQYNVNGVDTLIGKDKVKVMPDILITGGDGDSNGALSGLPGMKLMEELGGKVNPSPAMPPPVSPVAVKPLDPQS